MDCQTGRNCFYSFTKWAASQTQVLRYAHGKQLALNMITNVCSDRSLVLELDESDFMDWDETLCNHITFFEEKVGRYNPTVNAYHDRWEKYIMENSLYTNT